MATDKAVPLQWLEKLRKNLTTFSNITHMHGFHEIENAKSLFWKISWIIIVIGALVLTTYQTYRSVIQYSAHTTVTVILPLDSPLLFPPISLCFQHWIPWVNWKKAMSMNFTKESLLYAFSFLTNIFSPTVFNTAAAKITLLQTMKANNISTMGELYKRIAKPLPMVMGMFDKARLVDEDPFFNDIEFRMKGSDVFFCYRMGGHDVMNVLTGNTSDGNSSDGSGTVTSGNNLFNFSTQRFKYEFISSYMTEDEYSFNVGYWLLVKTNYWLTSLHDFIQNFTSFAFPYRVYPDAFSDKYVDVSDEFDSFAIELSPTVHRWMDKITAPCTLKQQAVASDSSCTDICDGYHSNDLNVCLTLDDAVVLGLDNPDRLCQNAIFFIPTLFEIYKTWKGAISDLFTYGVTPPITTTTITDNETLAKIEQKYADCKQACINPCEIWQYEFTSSAAVQPNVVRALSFVNQTDVNIYYPDSKSVLIIIEESAQTWEDFVATVGGLLGVWTGASILSFIQLAYYCCFYEMSCSCVADAIHHHGHHQGIDMHPRVKRSSVFKQNQAAAAAAASRNVAIISA